MSTFFKDTSSTDIQQYVPRTDPVLGRSSSPTNGAMWYDSASNSFHGVVNGAVQVIGGGVNGGTTAAAYVSSNCGGLNASTTPACFQVKGDWQYSGQCTWSSGGSTITCPSGTFKTDGSELGKRIFGTSGTNFALFQTGVCQLGCTAAVTITSVTDSAHASISPNTASGNSITAAPLFWGTNPTISGDDTTLSSADTFVGNACGTLHIGGVNSFGTSPLILPVTTKKFVTFNPKCQTQSGTSVAASGFRVEGEGIGSTLLLILPEYSTGSFGTANQMFGPTPGANVGGFVFRKLGITGGGNGVPGAGFAGKIGFLMPGDVSAMQDVYISGFGANQSTFLGMQAGTGSTTGPMLFQNANIDGFGFIPCSFPHAQFVDFFGGFCGDGAGVAIDVSGLGVTFHGGVHGTSTNVAGPSSTTGCQVSVDANAAATFIGSLVNQNGGATNTFCNSGGKLILDDVDATNTNAGATSVFNVSVAGSVTIMRNVKAIAVGAGSIPIAIATGAGKIISEGGNTISSSGTALSIAGTATYIGNSTDVITGGVSGLTAASKFALDSASITGTCTGTPAGAQTNGFYGMGANVSSTACAATVGLGVPMTRAGTAYLMIVSATAGGKDGTDAVYTALKNGATQTMTFTGGVSTFGFDGASAHQFTFVAGDRLSCQVVTEAATTLTNPTCTIYWQ